MQLCSNCNIESSVGWWNITHYHSFSSHNVLTCSDFNQTFHCCPLKWFIFKRWHPLLVLYISEWGPLTLQPISGQKVKSFPNRKLKRNNDPTIRGILSLNSRLVSQCGRVITDVECWWPYQAHSYGLRTHLLCEKVARQVYILLTLKLTYERDFLVSMVTSA